jgi:hypothetical protein
MFLPKTAHFEAAHFCLVGFGLLEHKKYSRDPYFFSEDAMAFVKEE